MTVSRIEALFQAATVSRRNLSVLRVLAASEYVTVPLCAPGPIDKLHASAMTMKWLPNSHHKRVLTVFGFTVMRWTYGRIKQNDNPECSTYRRNTISPLVWSDYRRVSDW
jgi:hypothetical protein